MTTRIIHICDVCQQDMAPGSRHYRFYARLTGINGEIKVAESKDYDDICSAACLLTRLNQMIAEVS
jgi:hypothetical protein